MKPQVVVAKDQVLPQFGAPLCQKFLLRILGVLDSISQGSMTRTPQGAQMREGA